MSVIQKRDAAMLLRLEESLDVSEKETPVYVGAASIEELLELIA